MEIEQSRTNQTSATPQSSIENLNLGLTYAITVAEETSDAGRELELEFLANDLEIKVGGEVAIHFSTAKNATNNTEHPVPAPFLKMIGSKALLRVGREGRVEKVLGHQMWLKTVVGDASGPAALMVTQQFSEDFFRQLADFGHGLLDRKVQPGESWPNRNEVPSPDLGKIVMDATIRLAGFEAHDDQQLAVIAVDGQLRSEPDRSSSTPPRMTIDHGSVAGKTWFDPAAGTLIESLVEELMQIKGSIAAAPGSTATNHVFTSDILQKVSLKLVDQGHPSSMAAATKVEVPR
jgi:hypothetical protein